MTEMPEPAPKSNETNGQTRRPLWKEPLLHFLIIGALLYGVDVWRQPPSSSTGLQPIVISSAQVESARKRAERTVQKPETRDDFVDDTLHEQIRREALVREARRMGLHRADKIVRRRLVQKMEFLLEDLADVPEPTDEELRDWVEENRDRYRRPATVSLRHIFFSKDRGDQSEDSARERARELKNSEDSLNRDSLDRDNGDTPSGDAFVHGPHVKHQTRSALSQKFGRSFARQVFGRAESRPDPLPEEWLGPLKSAYGFHLVRLEDYSPAEIPPLDQVRGPARASYLEERRQKAGERAVRKLVDRYPIRIEGVGDFEDDETERGTIDGE